MIAVTSRRFAGRTISCSIHRRILVLRSRQSTPDQRDHGALYYARADGSHIARVRAEMLSPNGVGLSPDGKTLYVADTLPGRLCAMTIEEPGVLAPGPPRLPGRLVATLPDYQLLDSLAVEADGNVCVGTQVNVGITVFSPDGDTQHVPLPDVGVTNICFGGADRRDAWIKGLTTGTLFHMCWPRAGLALTFNG